MLITLAISVLAQPLVIAGLGQSNMRGYDDPYLCVLDPADPACDDIPVGAQYWRDGVQQAEFLQNYTGVEQGMLTCLVSLGYEPVFKVRAVNGTLARTLNVTHIPLLLQDLSGLSLDAVVVINGEQDSATVAQAKMFWDRIVGPSYEATGPVGYDDTAANAWVQPRDESMMGQVRAVYPGVPFILTEVRTRGNQDLSFGDLGNGTYRWNAAVRWRQFRCADEGEACFVVGTQIYDVKYASDGSVISDVHYSAKGYWDLGWDLCMVIDLWALQSY